MNLIKHSFAGILSVLFLSAQAQTIPSDPQLRAGKLANGFTYYIRHNEQPKNRVELYLVNKVGSVLEDDDQQGLAHFMEHMNFNGTKNFPKNDLVDFLQHAGVRFGADLNAYTSFDETVFELPIPTDDPTMFGNGIKIMRDWAQDATLDPTEIEKERGVVLEEERLGKGAKDRMSRQYLPMLLNHARYADRLPIGKDEVLTKFSPAVIKRFHHDWYRPDLQALIVVGDIDVDKAEKLVKEKFSDLQNPKDERERIKYGVPVSNHGQFLAVTDKEETSTDLQVMFKHTGHDLATEQDYLSSIKENLLNEMLNSRKVAELSKEANPAFTGVSIGTSNFLSNIDMLSFSVSAKEGTLKEAFIQGWTVFERMKKYGFTQDELDRAKKNYLTNLENSVSEEHKTPSINYVKEYQRLFLHNQASPGIEWEYKFTNDHIGEIGLSDISQLLQNDLDVRDVDVLVTAPDKDKTALPDSATIQQWITTVKSGNIRPYKGEVVNQPLILHKPKPGKVVSKETIAAIGVTRLILSNGVNVILKTTNFKNDQILYGAFAPGGTSLYDGTDFDVAANAGALISHFGLAGFSPVQLGQLLTGKSVNSVANIGMRSETINAVSTPKDLETALQVTHLQFTDPRKDSLLFRNTINDAIAGLTNRGSDPNSIFADTISYVMGNYNYRSAPPTAGRLNKIRLDKAYQIYKDRFADASLFTFVFVGNFDVAQITPLLEQYLGSLPASHSNVTSRDLGIHIPSGKIVKKVYKGIENKAMVRLVFSGNYSYSPLANLQLKALGDILETKALQQLREDEGKVYSPQVQTVYNKYPQNRFAVIVSFGCAPKNVDHLIALLQKEMDIIRAKGPDEDDIAKFKAQYQKNIELALQDNSFWYSYLLGQAENKENFMEVNNAQHNLDQIDLASLKSAAEIFFSGKNVIQFELLPENN